MSGAQPDPAVQPEPIPSTAGGTQPAPTLPIASRRRAFTRLAPLLGARWGWILLLLIAGLVNAAAGLVGPWAIGRLVDELPAGAGADVVWTAAIAVALAGVAMAVGTWVGAWALARVAMPAVADLRTEVVTAALTLDAPRIERAGTGDLVSRVADDSRTVSDGAAQVLPLVVESLLVVVVSAVGLTAVDWRLGLVGLVAVPMYWLTLRWYLPRSEPLYRAERAAIGRRAGRLLGGLTGARTLRAYRAEAVELDRIDASSAQARDLSIGVFRFLTRAFSRNNRAEAVVLSLLLVTGFWLVWTGASTAGAVTTAALVFHRLFNPIGALVGLFDQVQSAGASLTRMVGVIDAAAEAPTPAAATPAPADSAAEVPAAAVPPAAGQPADSAAAIASDVARPGVGLRLTDLWFTYDEDPDSTNHVLRGVDLTVAPGEVVAVVGTTGAGKSTLAKIAAGIARPTRGTAQLTITALSNAEGAAAPELTATDLTASELPLSGVTASHAHDLTALPAAQLRAHVVMVAQEVHTFVGTLRDNVALPAPDAPPAAVEQAMRTVGADWAFALPRGIDTVVGDGGHRLSPLQEQMLALARVVLADPELAILDEATAEAGSAGAHVLESAAAAALAGRGALVVAHRLSQAQAADRVLVLEDGLVVEQGPHAALVAAGGIYARLWEAWAG